jgi:hypothetical protein
MRGYRCCCARYYFKLETPQFKGPEQSSSRTAGNLEPDKGESTGFVAPITAIGRARLTQKPFVLTPWSCECERRRVLSSPTAHPRRLGSGARELTGAGGNEAGRRGGARGLARQHVGDPRPQRLPDGPRARPVKKPPSTTSDPAQGLPGRRCSSAAKVIASPGWNVATGMILDIPEDLPSIPDNPSKADAERALKVLLRPFRGYLRDNPGLKPILAAAALTAALCASLPTSPAIVLDGNTIGAGKGKAARALAVIATGELPAVIAEGHNDEETEKRIAAAILQGAPAILLDNLQPTLASTTLESILTDSVARIRKFGSLSDDVTTECRI